MKVRNGFVSNSSASSFIVYYKPGEHCCWVEKNDDSMIATEEDVKKLKEYGFFETCEGRPDTVERRRCGKCPDEKRKFKFNGKTYPACERDISGINLGFAVSCNEYEPIGFLLKNNIPFMAQLPYGEGLMVYRRGQEKVLVLYNEGEMYLMRAYKRGPGYFGKGEMADCMGDRKKDYKTAKLISKKAALNE